MKTQTVGHAHPHFERARQRNLRRRARIINVLIAIPAIILWVKLSLNFAGSF